MNDQDFSLLWQEEYRAMGIPSSFREEPSGAVADFFTTLEGREIRGGVALDLGCGTGRNSLFLARSGFEVHSIDIVPSMIASLQRTATELGLSPRLHAYCQSVTDPWPVQTASIDIAIDTFCYKHQIDARRRKAYRSELFRALKPGGLYLLTLAGVDDGYYGPLLATSPNPTERVIVDPGNKIPSVLFTKGDIEAEFRDTIIFSQYQHKQKDGMMHGASYPRSTHVFIGQKK